MAPARPLALARFNPAQPGARGMKIAATGLLVLMAAVFLTARSFEPAYPWLGYVKAFAEAAMVGGLADWFAVTALFRHPLGLPIPHTAIIPRNKDRIGEALARFLNENFLIPGVVARRMQNIDVAGAAGRFLKTPAGEGNRIRAGASRLIADIFESLDDERLGGIVKGALSTRLRKMEVSPAPRPRACLGDQRGPAFADARGGDPLDRARARRQRAAHSRDGQEEGQLGAQARRARRQDRRFDPRRHAQADREMAEDPAHPVRLKVEEALASLANDLQTNPETRARVEAMKEQLLDNKSVGLWLDTLWQKGREAIIRAARNPDAVMAGKLGEVLRSMGQTLEQDRRIRAAINQFARRAVVGMASSYGDSIVKLVSDTIRGWDAQTVTDRLEAAVGRDLQYIRINGTLVGGLVGLGLHALDML